jgi:hypothetical protein
MYSTRRKGIYPTEHTNGEGSVLVHTAIQMERQFAEDGYLGSRTGPALLMHQGDVPIVISSSHAVKHPREGRLKLAEILTGTLALQLASLTRTSVLVYAHTSEEDPNYDVDGPYKQQLIRLVESTSARFVLDIHGLGQWRPEEIAIGTAFGKTLGQQVEILQVLIQELTKGGFTNILIDDPERFNAARPTTITSFIWRELGVPALQLEIHKKYRDAKKAPDNYLKILSTLCEGIQAIQQILEKTR